MTHTPTVTISGQLYDAVTGLPVAAVNSTDDTPTPSLSKTPATKLHSTPQRSITLRRKAVKQPIAQKHAIKLHHIHKRPAMTDIHPRVKKFAPHPVAAVASPAASVTEPAILHPHVAKAHAASRAKAQPSTPATAATIKNVAITNAVANTNKKPPLRERLMPRQRTAAVLSSVFAVVLLGGYFTYLNMPLLSVRVAAAQAGISAEYPNYRPDGYALNGPVTYGDGRVSMTFKANGGPQEFTVNQSKSSWDSDAVLDKYVAQRAGTSYIPYTERGLKIYTYDNNAAWVNGGILYTIEGDAPLSSEQIRRVATSLL